MDLIFQQIRRQRCIPMVKHLAYEQSESLANSLINSHLHVVNISQQMDDGLEILRYLSAEFPTLVTGGGNVLTEGEARNAIEAGARFIFSPLFDPAIIQLCQQMGVFVLPVTKSGILAIEQNLKVLGFYPIEKLGGLDSLTDLAHRFGFSFIVAGGITDETVLSYLSNPHVIGVTGSWMLDATLITHNRWDLITDHCKRVYQQYAL